MIPKGLFTVFFASLLCVTKAQEQHSPILFIYDASGSMWGQMDGKTKKELASDVLASTVDQLPDETRIGLIAYGHRKKDDCDDIEYMVDLTNTSKSDITEAVKGVQPTGKTPLARSATIALQALEQTNTRATIILITDGIESCDGDICQVVTDAKTRGILFKLHIVGFGLAEGEKAQLQCAARAGEGQYYDAGNAVDLGDVLKEATTRTIDKPEPNFSLYAVKNGKPVDAWIRPKEAVTHKEFFGSRTYRDTAWVYLPPGSYEVEVKPLENSDIPGTVIFIEMKEGETRHQNVSFDGGILEVTTTNNGEPWDGMVKMYDKHSGQVIANTRTYGKTKQMEVMAGRYQVTFQALQIEGIDILAKTEDVDIEANTTTSLSHDFKSGIAMIGVRTNSGDLIDATVNIFEKTSGKNVAAGRTYTSDTSNPRRFILHPGTYEVKISTLGAHKGHTDTFTISVKAKETLEKIVTY